MEIYDAIYIDQCRCRFATDSVIVIRDKNGLCHGTRNNSGRFFCERMNSLGKSKCKMNLR